jgi:Protein of unknown function (DUF3592)
MTNAAVANPVRALLLFGLFWTAIVGVFDVLIGWSMVASIRAETFATTTGTVTHSEVTRHFDSDGDTYGVDIRYTYDVDGRTFEGDTYRYLAGSSSDSDWAREAVAAHPVGGSVTVHYDAADPADAVLQTGIDPATLFMLMFLTPFNIVMLATWWLGGERAWHRWQGTQPKVVDWSYDGASTRVRLPKIPPVFGAFVGVGGGAFAAIFVVAFTAGFHPSMDFVLTMWVLVAICGAASFAWLRRKQQAGVYDLVIGDRTVDLPALFDRKERQTIERKAIGGVAVEKLARGDNTPVYEIKLERRDGGPAKIAEWYDAEKAEALAAWLRERLQLRK